MMEVYFFGLSNTCFFMSGLYLLLKEEFFAAHEEFDIRIPLSDRITMI